MLPQPLKSELAILGQRLGVKRLVLFGSRARDEERPRSDIDLAVFGLPRAQESAFWDGIDELPTLLKFDIVFIDDHTSPELLAEIHRDEVPLYEAP